MERGDDPGAERRGPDADRAERRDRGADKDKDKGAREDTGAHAGDGALRIGLARRSPRRRARSAGEADALAALEDATSALSAVLLLRRHAELTLGDLADELGSSQATAAVARAVARMPSASAHRPRASQLVAALERAFDFGASLEDGASLGDDEPVGGGGGDGSSAP